MSKSMDSFQQIVEQEQGLKKVLSAGQMGMIAIGGGVYEITKNLDTTLTVQYKFVNGNTYESGSSACGVDDGLGGYNRVYNVMGTNTILPTVCFNACTNCILPAFADVTFKVVERVFVFIISGF